MKNIFFLPVLIYCTTLNAQVIQEWRIDNTVQNPTVIVTDVVNDGVNTYVSLQDYNSSQSAYILKLDSLGNILKSDTINYSASGCETRMVLGNGAIYVCGHNDSTVSHTKVKLVKYDSFLSEQWSVNSIDTNAANFFSTRILYSGSEDKIYIVSQKSDQNGYYSVILKYDANGSLIWESDSIPSLGLNCIRIDLDNSGNIFLGGFIYNPGTDEDFTLIKVDTSGSIAWLRTMNVPLDDRIEDLATDEWGNIYAFGYFSDAARSRVVKYDAAGNFVWMKDIPNYYGSKIIVNSSGIYIAGTDSVFGDRLTVVRLDSLGTIISSNYTNEKASGIISLKLNLTSELYVCYSHSAFPHYQWGVGKFDSMLNYKWILHYPDTPSFAYPTAFSLTNDGFIVNGLIDPSISTVYFREINTTSIDESKRAAFDIWPNPTNGIIYIRTDNSVQKILFSLFDVSSRPVYETRLKSGLEEISIHNLAEGVYIYKLITDGNIFKGKLIIKK